MSDLIVTIARQNGSGGRDVGKALAELMGVRCYDREIIEKASEESGISIDEIERREERNTSGITFYGITAPNPVFSAQSRAIASLAGNGSCVFVGRCADYVLRDRKDVLKVFIRAPVEARAARSARRNGISEKEAFARVTDMDRERALYYQRYTGLVWGSVDNYNLSIDTGRICIEDAAELIVEYARMSGYDI